MGVGGKCPLFPTALYPTNITSNVAIISVEDDMFDTSKLDASQMKSCFSFPYPAISG